jgi:hypothetical protein
MNRSASSLLSIPLLLALAGCSNYKPAAPVAPPKASPAPRPGPGTLPPGTSAAAASPPASAPPNPPVSSPPAAAPQPSASNLPSVAAQPQVRLSAGVALPQTLPDGTAMGFHVDYQFVQGQPPSNSQNRYFWVIRRAQGQPARLGVQLQQKGELDTFIPWRPEEGPFQSHIEDQSGRKISDSIDMR